MSLINHRIRRRREDRIKRIQTTVPVSAKAEPSITKLNDDKKWDDPEFVWKHAGNNAWKNAESGPAAIQKPPFYSRIKGAVVVSICLFAAVWLLFQLPHPWAVKGQLWVEEVMTREIDYAGTAKWYAQWFEGSPSFLPSFFNRENESPSQPAQGLSDKLYVPASGEVIASFNASSPGIWIKGKPNEPVTALTEGWVIYAAESTESEFTVIIQHADHMQSVYSNLSDVKLKKNDWVEGGEQVGRLTEHRENGIHQFFFAIKKDEQYLDPQDVVSFD